jgi:HSP20 family protein
MITPTLPTAPVTPFERLNQMMEELFPTNQLLPPRPWMPPVDIKESDKELLFEAEIPAILRENIEIELLGDTLVLRGKRTEEKKEETEGYIRRERNYGAFQRSFRLDVPIKPEKVEAEYKDGLLLIHVPKAETIKPQRVEIRK